MAWAWVYEPHSGGIKIPSLCKYDLPGKVEAFARTRPWHPEIQLKLRFKSQFCYVDTVNTEDQISPLCRLRHFSKDSWSFALFTYSNERYEPCAFSDGKLQGTWQDALLVCEPFIF